MNFYLLKRYLLYVKKVKIVKNIDMKMLIFLKFIFCGLYLYIEIEGFGFSNIVNICGLCELFG